MAGVGQAAQAWAAWGRARMGQGCGGGKNQIVKIGACGGPSYLGLRRFGAPPRAKRRGLVPTSSAGGCWGAIAHGASARAAARGAVWSGGVSSESTEHREWMHVRLW